MSIKEIIKAQVGVNNASKIITLQKQLNRLIGLKFTNSSIGKVKLYKLAVNRSHTFFGYYDKTPFSLDNSSVLAIVTPNKNRPLNIGDIATVGYFNFYAGEKCNFNPVGETLTWCWQQGCRLQWFPKNENELVIYNKIVKQSYGSVVQNIHTKEIIREYSTPIYDIDKKGEWGLTLNFSRLQRLRPGYGYMVFPDKTEKDFSPKDDGIWLMDVSSGKKRLIISLDYLSKLDPVPSMEKAEHYINHIAFNPSGDRFMFFHLWKKDNKRFNRLITADLDGRNLYILSNEGIVSHYTWKSDNELLVYSAEKVLGTNYKLYQDKSKNVHVIGEGVLNQDGHPSYSLDGKLILTDTYPDKYGDRHLLLYSENEGLKELGRFFSPNKFDGEYRCDLHPRWDRIGSYVAFDSVHKGIRALYVMEIDS
jgi:Tol biopolymer transport system component